MFVVRFSLLEEHHHLHDQLPTTNGRLALVQYTD